MSELRDHVRLKPFSPKDGYNRRDWHAPWGYKYEAGKWMCEPADSAEARAAYLQTIVDKRSGRKSFDVCTKAEADDIALREEAGDLIPVASTAPQPPVAPRGGGKPRVSLLNLPKPKSELAAAAMAKLAESAQATAEPPPAPAPVPPKSGRRRRTPD